MKKEIEVFGVTYDRYVLLQLHKIMTTELGLKRVLEMPSHGAKAAGSLYSIGFGLAKLLVGSPSDRVASYRDHPLYGTLHLDWGRQELTTEIDRLIEQGYLNNRQGRLVLSPTGQARLHESKQAKPAKPPQKEK